MTKKLLTCLGNDLFGHKFEETLKAESKRRFKEVVLREALGMPTPLTSCQQWGGGTNGFRSCLEDYSPRRLGPADSVPGIQDSFPADHLLGISCLKPPSLLREKREALEKEVRDLLQKGATKFATAQESTNLFRSSFLTPRKPDRWRPILNLKPLNKAFITARIFRMETLVTFTLFLRRGKWATSIDLKDAYLHVPIHKDHQRFWRSITRTQTTCSGRCPSVYRQLLGWFPGP